MNPIDDLAREFLTASGVAYWYDEDIKYELAYVLEEEYLKSIPAGNRDQAKGLIDQAVDQVRWKSVEDRVAESLAQDFTANELKDLINFFQTAVGQKLARIPLERRVNAITKELLKSPMLRLRDQMERLSAG